MTTLQRVDFNLFRLLEALYEERNVSRAAERLFITPSAVSHALRRLRLMMGDELFVRGVNGMVPTPRAHEVAAQLRLLLPRLSEIISPPDFEPSSSERIFSLACVPYLSATLLPVLAADVAATAPRARLDVRLLYSNVVDDLDSGLLDVSLGHFRRTPARLVVEEILRDTYVWVMRRDHPAVADRLTVERIATLPHIDLLIDSQSGVHRSYDMRQGLERLIVQNGIAAIDEALLAAGLRRQVRYHAPDSISGMSVAAQTDGICLVPEKAARRFADTFGLTIRQPTLPLAPLVIQMLTHAEYGSKPAVRWLMDRVRAAAGQANL